MSGLGCVSPNVFRSWFTAAKAVSHRCPHGNRCVGPHCRCARPQCVHAWRGAESPGLLALQSACASTVLTEIAACLVSVRVQHPYRSHCVQGIRQVASVHAEGDEAAVRCGSPGCWRGSHWCTLVRNIALVLPRLVFTAIPELTSTGSGLHYEYVAQALGARSQSAKTYLEKYYESFDDASDDDLILHAIKSLRGSSPTGTNKVGVAVYDF